MSEQLISSARCFHESCRFDLGTVTTFDSGEKTRQDFSLVLSWSSFHERSDITSSLFLAGNYCIAMMQPSFNPGSSLVIFALFFLSFPRASPLQRPSNLKDPMPISLLGNSELQVGPEPNCSQSYVSLCLLSAWPMNAKVVGRDREPRRLGLVKAE